MFKIKCEVCNMVFESQFKRKYCTACSPEVHKAQTLQSHLSRRRKATAKMQNLFDCVKAATEKGVSYGEYMRLKDLGRDIS